MDDALRVRSYEHVEEMIGDREHLVLIEPAPEPLAALFERLAVEEINHEECSSVFRNVVVRDVNDSVATDRCSICAAAEVLGEYSRVSDRPIRCP